MGPYANRDRLVVFDADGTIIDAFGAIAQTFLQHGMALGDLERFQKRRRLLKYLGGLREFPNNLRRQFGKQSRKQLLTTLTDYYRDEARLYPGIVELLHTLLDAPNVRVGLITRNVTIDPQETLGCLFRRHGVDLGDFDHFACLPLREQKTGELRRARERLAVSPARTIACGDEHGDYLAAIAAGVYPLIVSYGFEDRARLHEGFGVPVEQIADSPAEFCAHLLHALDLPEAGSSGQGSLMAAA